MRMVEANLYPVIPYLHVQQHDWEVTSMSDILHTDRRSKIDAEHRTIESRLIFSACYLLFLSGAILKRFMPRRRGAGVRESIFREASSAASILVGSSFMGL
ncbi:MAG: hypothetical protein ABI561_18000 [Bradyrhizobium sp.]